VVADPDEPATDTAGDPHAFLRARLTRVLEGRYRIREILGVGGMGVVFLADDLGLDRTVAIKVLPPELSRDENVVTRFRREARTAARLDHPGIVPIHRVESEGGLHFFVMKYIAGRSLEMVIADQAPVPIPFVTRVLREAAAALAHAHRQGVVHRDVKPDNIMIDTDERVLIADFGISTVSAVSSGATTVAKLTESGGVVGTPHYMAPEHALGQAVDGRTDQYSLAVVGYQMLTGRVPFDDETPHAIVHLHISEAPPRLTELRSDVPPHLATAIARAMSKSPQNRFPTMEDFAVAVGAGEALGSTGATTTTRVLAADDQELDRVLDRVLTGKRPGLTASLHRRASWIAAATLMLAGLGVTAAWVGATHDSSRGERAKGGGSRTTVTSPRAVDPPTKRPTKPVSKPVSKPAEPSVTQAGAPAARRSAMLSVTSSPKATLYVDGRRIGETPISNHVLTVGRTYQARLERKGYRTKRESITPADTRSIRRSYTLKRDTRR
jgi:serine/threonine-protein kinase